MVSSRFVELGPLRTSPDLEAVVSSLRLQALALRAAQLGLGGDGEGHDSDVDERGTGADNGHDLNGTGQRRSLDRKVGVDEEPEIRLRVSFS